MTVANPMHVVVVKVLRDYRGLGLDPMDLAMNAVDEAYALDLVIDGEIDLALTDVEARINALWSNDSPCWECGRGAGDRQILWMDDSSEYRHEICPT